MSSLTNRASMSTCQEGGGMQESARPRGAVSREGPSIPVLAAMSPELKIVHETHKGGVTAALLPGSSTGSSQSSTGSARRSCCPCVDNAVIHKTSRKGGWMCPGRLERRFSTSALPPTPRNSKPSSPVSTGQVPCPHEFVCAPERRRTSRVSLGRPSEGWRRSI